VQGFCHCQQGYWGLDCSRSKAYGSSKGLHPARDRLRIYMYELPTWVAHRPVYEYQELYRANMWFLRYLSRDWAVRTENPWEANMFFMPLFNTHNGGNVGWQEGSASERRWLAAAAAAAAAAGGGGGVKDVGAMYFALLVLPRLRSCCG
jgi:hypothetical protein